MTMAASTPAPDDDRGVYGISVAAELVGLPAANLRLYEARGLLEPARTDGGTRRYSANDLTRLRRISDLLDAGVNLAGIGLLMDLQDENQQLRGQIDSGDDTDDDTDDDAPTDIATPATAPRRSERP